MSILGVTVIYLMLQIGSLGALDWHQMLDPRSVAAQSIASAVVANAWGTTAAGVVTVLILITAVAVAVAVAVAAGAAGAGLGAAIGAGARAAANTAVGQAVKAGASRAGTALANTVRAGAGKVAAATGKVAAAAKSEVTSAANKVASAAKSAFNKEARACVNSFAGATPVLLADGTSKPIDQIKVGDKVANAAPDSPTVEAHTVTAVHVTDIDHDFVDLTLDTLAGPKTITTTAHHLFWDTTTHTWTDAQDLKTGEELDTSGNGHATIQAIRPYTATIRTYNLTIDTLHTYYVEAGTTPVLVHNSSACLGGNLRANGEHPTTPDPEAHHIVPENHKLASGARDVLAKHGIDIDSAENGVWLGHDTHRGTFT